MRPKTQQTPPTDEGSTPAEARPQQDRAAQQPPPSTAPPSRPETTAPETTTTETEPAEQPALATGEKQSATRAAARASAGSGPKAVFIPPIPSAEFGLANDADDGVAAPALVFILSGLLLLLATNVPDRVWALGGVHQPTKARAVGMLLGMASILLGLIVLFSSS